MLLRESLHYTIKAESQHDAIHGSVATLQILGLGSRDQGALISKTCQTQDQHQAMDLDLSDGTSP